MFQSAALRLTLWYLAVVMALSLGCSVALYRVSSGDLSRDATRQLLFFNNNLAPEDFNNYSKLRLGQLHEDQKHLKGNLFLFNLLVLCGGGAISYWLARRTLKPIEQTLENQKRFTADASHELRTPLTAIQAEVEVALRNKNLTKDEAKRLLSSNLEEVSKLKDLSNGLLMLASEDEKNLDFEVLSLRQILKDSVLLNTKTANLKKIGLEAKLNDALVKGDRQSLTELINIILDNAVKYSSKDSRILVTSGSRGKLAFITVKDEGEGIEAQDLPNIFDRFYRTEKSRQKNSGGGYGLGLAIAKKIVEQHSGSIEVKSAPKQGSTFIIKLPLIKKG